MIECNERNVIELNNSNVSILSLDRIACYVLVGGNPGGTEGSVYVFQLEENELKVFSGNIFYDDLSKDKLIGILPQIEKFYERWNFEKNKDGWTWLPFVMGHYVFIRDFMADDISNNWKTVEAKYHFERLVKGVFLTVRQHEDEMRKVTQLEVRTTLDEKMDDDQKKIVEFLLKYASVWKDSKSLKALLADCIPDKKVLRNIIINAYEEGIYDELKSSKDFKLVIYKYKRILCDDYGIGEKYANWAIETWLFIYGLDNKTFAEHAISDVIESSENIKIANSEILCMHIDELEFSVRTYNVLKRAGISSVGDLLELSKNELESIRNLGRKSLEEIMTEVEFLRDVINSQTKEEYIEQRRNRIRERRQASRNFSFSKSYDDFIDKNKNSGMWDFNDVIIHRKLTRGQYVNTYFCQYDNPPIEIFKFIAKKDGNKYEMRVGVWNLSKETRNQPIKIRYEVATRQGSHIHDYVDTVTPAPKSQDLVIKFEHDGDEKPIFRIIE